MKHFEKKRPHSQGNNIYILDQYIQASHLLKCNNQVIPCS